MDAAPSVVVDVSGILEESGGTTVAEGLLELESIEVGPLTFVATAAARYDITLMNAGSGILAQGATRLDVATPCSRCLTRYALVLSGRIERFWAEGEDAGESGAELDLEPLEGTTIDLGPAIYASLAAEAPWVPLHAEDCRGLCGVCGADLNERSCDCEPAHTESPFASLEGLFGDDPAEGDD